MAEAYSAWQEDRSRQQRAVQRVKETDELIHKIRQEGKSNSEIIEELGKIALTEATIAKNQARESLEASHIIQRELVSHTIKPELIIIDEQQNIKEIKRLKKTASRKAKDALDAATEMDIIADTTYKKMVSRR